MDIDDMPAGCEMDARVAEKVMGWTHNGMWWSLPGETVETSRVGQPPEYSTDIAAAWDVAEKLKHMTAEDEWFEMGFNRKGDLKGLWWVSFTFHVEYEGDAPRTTASGNTAPLAICRLALKVVERQLE